MKSLARIPLLVLALACSSARAASPYTETFDTDTAGWQDRDAFELTLTHSTDAGNPGGCLVGTFAPQGGPPVAEIDAIVATGSVSTANFVGDYPSAGINLIGLDFRADQILPSEALVRVVSGGSNSIVFFRSFLSRIVSTGAWHTIALSLASRSLGGWAGGTDETFAEALTNIARVEIQLTRNGIVAQSYLIDNVYVARLPEASAQAASGDGVTVTWTNLRANTAYRAEAAAAPVGSWSVLSNFTAAGTTHAVLDTNAAAAQAYRLLIE